MKKKLLSAISIIFFLFFGLYLRQTSKEQDKLNLKNEISKYEEAVSKIDDLKANIENEKKLNIQESNEINVLEEDYNSLLKEFEEYKSKYPESINEEIDNLKKDNEEYSNQIAKLETNIDNLNDKVIEHNKVVLSSSTQVNNNVTQSSSNNSYSSSSSSSSTSNNGSGNSVNSSNNSYQESSKMVYANGGKSKSDKYHSSPTAHNMEGAIPMSESEAKSKGYVACKRCY